MIDVATLRARLERRKGQREQIQRIVNKLEHELALDKRQVRRVERALEIVKHVGLVTQRQLEYHLSEQVSLAMSAVFDNPYELKVLFQEKRGRTEVNLLFSRGDLEFPPMGNAGGGTIDVAALALRVAYWSMRQDHKVRPLLLLDEPFSQLKGENANRRALSVLQEISHRLSCQIIMISDERVPRDIISENADRVFFVKQHVGESTVECVST